MSKTGNQGFDEGKRLIEPTRQYLYWQRSQRQGQVVFCRDKPPAKISTFSLTLLVLLFS